MTATITLWKLDGSKQLWDTDTSVAPEVMAKELVALEFKVLNAYKGIAPVFVCQGSGCPTGAANFFECDEPATRHQMFLARQAGFILYDELTFAAATALTDELQSSRLDRPVPIPWGREELPTLVKVARGPETPFPLSQADSKHSLVGALAGSTARRYLGRGVYKAHNIGGLLTILASGTAPNLATKVTLVQLPVDVYPPHYALFFSDQGIVLPQTRPFAVEATFYASERLEYVTVLDADGLHAVPVENF